MENPLNKTDRGKLRTAMAEVLQAKEQGERMIRAGMDVQEELNKLTELAKTYQKMFDEFGQ
jgi:hypothetical protein